MINITELLKIAKLEGYSEESIEAKICQDILLVLLSKSRFSRNITIKGGVVMRSISNNVRRATLDLDLDFIKYPLTEDKIRALFFELDGIEGIQIKIVGPIEELKHQDYSGKRVFAEVQDAFGNTLTSKIDIGVHKHMSLKQEEYCFDVSLIDDRVSLLINSKEQIFTEKLKSLLRFGYLSSRFKDVYDIYYLCDYVDKKDLLDCFEILIFKDSKMRENNIDDILNRIETTFSNKTYLLNFNTSNKNWVGVDNDAVLLIIANFLKTLSNNFGR